MVREMDRDGRRIKNEIKKRGIKQRFICEQIGVSDSAFSDMLRNSGNSRKKVRRLVLEYLEM